MGGEGYILVGIKILGKITGKSDSNEMGILPNLKLIRGWVKLKALETFTR